MGTEEQEFSRSLCSWGWVSFRVDGLLELQDVWDDEDEWLDVEYDCSSDSCSLGD